VFISDFAFFTTAQGQSVILPIYNANCQVLLSQVKPTLFYRISLLDTAARELT